MSDFDDLIPKSGGGAFDDLIPKAKPQPRGASMVVNGRPMSVATEEPQRAQQSAPMPWGEVGVNALRNLPASAGHFVGSIWDAVTSPVQTAKVLGDVAAGVINKTGRPGDFRREGDPEPTPEELQRRARIEGTADAVGRLYAERYGTDAARRNTLATDPVGVLGDVATIAAPVAGAPGKLGAAARMIDPVNVLVQAPKLAAKAAEIPVSVGLGMSTGAGTSSVRAAARAGAEGGEKAEAFQKAMRGNSSIEDTVSTAKSAVEQIRADRSTAYKADKADLSKDATVMDFSPIEGAVDRASEVGSFRGRSGTGPAVTTEPKAQGVVDEMRKVVEDWKGLDPAEYHTPEGIDALKRTLGNVRDSTGPGTPERVAADRVYRAVRQQLVDQAPGYAGMMERYETASDKLKEVTKTLSLGEKATGDTAGRKLLSATRSGANTNYGERVKLIDELARHEPTLPYQIAGHSLNALAPQGIIGRGSLMGSVLVNPANALSLPAFMPRVVGEGAYYLGKVASPVDRARILLRLNEANALRAGRGAFQTGRLQEAQ